MAFEERIQYWWRCDRAPWGTFTIYPDGTCSVSFYFYADGLARTVVVQIPEGEAGALAETLESLARTLRNVAAPRSDYAEAEGRG